METVKVTMPDGSIVDALMVKIDGTAPLDNFLTQVGVTHWPEISGYVVHHYGDNGDHWVAKPVKP